MSSAKAQPLAPAAAEQRRLLEDASGWLLPAILTPLVILQLGYSYGTPNHVIYLPWVLRRLDPGLLANDWFSNTVPVHASAIAFIVWLERFLPLPLALLFLHVGSVFFLLWAAERLTNHLFGDRWVFCVGLFLMLYWGTEGLGSNTLWGDSVVPHNVAVPVCLLTFYLTLKDRPVSAALAAAAATWIHIQLGALTMLVTGAGMLLGWRRLGLRRVLLAGAVYLAAVAPTVIPQWIHYVSGPSFLSAREYFDIHALLRHPHHLVPSTWPGAAYYQFFLILGIAAAAGGWRRQPHRTTLVWAAIILALCVVGTVFVELIPVKLIIRLQLFRMTIFVKFFALLYAARFLLTVVEQGGALEKICGLAILTIHNFTLVGVAMALIFAVRRNRRWIWGLGLFAAGVVAGVAVVATTSRGIPLFWQSFGISSRGVWVAPVTLLAVAAIVWRRTRLLPAALLSVIVAVRLVFGFPHFGYDHPPEDEWYRFCRQIRASTPRDAVFITPPYTGGFQLFAERAEVADWKNITYLERDLVEWKRRLDDLAGATDWRCSGWPGCADVLVGAYSRLQDADFLRLARKYRAQYLVTTLASQRLHFPEVFRTGSCVLYRVPE